MHRFRVSSSKWRGDSLERRWHDWKRIQLKRSLPKYTIYSYENIVYISYIFLWSSYIYCIYIYIYISLYTIYDVFVYRIHYSVRDIICIWLIWIEFCLCLRIYLTRSFSRVNHNVVLMETILVYAATTKIIGIPVRCLVSHRYCLSYKKNYKGIHIFNSMHSII